MRLSETVVNRRRLVVLVWALAFLAATPAILNYSHFISYSQSSSAISSSESSKAQAALAGLSPQNSTLVVVVKSSGSAVETGDNILEFQSDLASKHLAYFTTSTSAFSEYANFLEAVQGESGLSYVEANGLARAPGFIADNSVSADNSTYLVTLNFNVTESFRTANNTYPAQSATPVVRSLAQGVFGSNAKVTGQGAIAYDTQSLSSSSGFVFAFTFVFLAIAVAVTLGSLISPIVALLFVSMATGLGYVSIYLTGLALGHVDFTVTYTLTAVILGVTTDYLVFILSRYREGLRQGLTSQDALVAATSKAGSAVLVSGVTVAGGLGVLSLVADLVTWGPVLLLAILMTVLLATTLLPAVAAMIGPRMFLKRSIKLVEKTEYRKSRFYRITAFSSRRKYMVVGVILLLAAPAVYFWFNVPTTYNFNEGLPKNLQSVEALNEINQKFGSNLIYPTYVIENFTQSLIMPNGTITDSGRAALARSESQISGLVGVKEVAGPLSASGQGTGSNPFIFDGGHSAYFLVFTNFDPYSSQQLDLVKALRQDSGFLVGGLSSSIIDLQNANSTTYSQLEILILVVVACVLGVSFRSIKFPLISLTGVFISITWTTAALYLISTYLLGEGLIYLIPIVLYVILMSVGNDFSVFIFSRVKEEQAKLGEEEGLARAMVGSGRVVTALGVILAVSLGSLGLVPFGFLQQIGIAFVISLLLDTFVIRTFYFPAMIRILQEEHSQK